MFVVRQQRVVGTKQPPHIHRVMNRSVEVCVIADAKRRQHPHILLPNQVRFHARPVCRICQQFRSTPPHRTRFLIPRRDKSLQAEQRQMHVDQPGSSTTTQIEDLISDRQPETMRPLFLLPDAERQILQREVRRGIVCGIHPASRQSHPNPLRSRTGSAKEQDPKLMANCSRTLSTCSLLTICPCQRIASLLTSKAAASCSSSVRRTARWSAPSHASAPARNRFTKPCIGKTGLPTSAVNG